MNKDAYYFPHFSIARNDIKIRRLRKELGVEGYGIYFMILEILRDQEDFKYPLSDLDLMADDIKTSEEKLKVVISKYDLFTITEDHFFSPKFNEFLEPYLDKKERRKIDGIKGNLIKYGKATKDQLSKMSDKEIIALNDSKGRLLGGRLGGESGSDRKESKVKESKVKKTKQTIVAPESGGDSGASDVSVEWEEFWQYAEAKSFHPEYARHLYDSLVYRGWKNKDGNLVENWQAYLNLMHKFQRTWLNKNLNTETQGVYQEL